MNIGIIIGRIGGLDGVALETEKWIYVLKKAGHNVFLLSGEYEDRFSVNGSETLLPSLSFFSEECIYGQDKAFYHPESDPTPLMEHIENTSDSISQNIIDWVKENKLKVLISENASALPSHFSMGLGIKKAMQKLDIPIICHDHDYAWERGDRYVSTHEVVNQFIADTFPLRLPNVVYAVINTNAKNTLKSNYNLDATVVPNVMDFSKPFGVVTNESKRMYEATGLDKNDILLFQITRVVRRKGIETAIELVRRLEDKRIKLIITGSKKDATGEGYVEELLEQIDKNKMHKQVFFDEDHFTGSSNVFTLNDAYANARACTYFSTYEGFGNAFIESVVARTPIFVNNYKPVYMPDIGSKGFKTVMLEDNFLTDNAVDDVREVLFNTKLNKEIADYNFEIGKKYFSFETLDELLAELIKKATT